MANMQTTNGGNTAALRYQTSTSDEFTVYVQEEQSKDKEMDHVIYEVVGYLYLWGSGSNGFLNKEDVERNDTDDNSGADNDWTDKHLV